MQDVQFIRDFIENVPSKNWEKEDSGNENAHVYRYILNKGWSTSVLKCEAQLDNIPKHIVLKAIADLNVRKKWDDILGEMEVLDQ